MSFRENRKNNVVLPLMSALLAVILLSGCMSKEERQQEYFERAEALFDAGDFDKAKLEVKNVLQLDPANGPARFMLYKISLEAGDKRAALKHLAATIDNDPGIADARIAMGQILLVANRPDDALEHAQAVLSADPDNADALSLVGSIRLKENDTAAALEKGRQALSLEPANLNALDLLAQVYGEQAPAELLDEVDRAIELEPDEPNLKLLRASLLNKAKRIDEVVEIYRALVQKYPEELEHYKRLANYLIFFDRLEESEDFLREMVAAQPESVEVKLWLAEFIASVRNDFSGAEDTIKGYISEQPDIHDFRFALAELYMSRADERAKAVLEEIIDLDGDGPDALRARNQLAFVYVFSQELGKAEALFDEVLEIEPNNVDALTAKARFSLNNGYILDAISDLRSVVRDNPGASAPRITLAEAYTAAGSTDLAIDAYRSAVELGAGRMDVFHRIAELLMSKGDYEEAERILRNKMESGPVFSNTLELLAAAHRAQEEWDSALAIAERLDTNEETQILASQIRATTLREQGELSAAVSEFESILERQPDTATALTGLVNAKVEQDKLDEALEYLVEHSDKYPQQPRAYELLGILYTREGSLDKAIESYSRAIRVAPDQVGIYMGLASVYREKGDLQSVIETYNSGLEGSPESIELLMLRAEAEQANQNYEQALQTYERVLDLQSGQKLAKNNLAMLLVDRFPSKANIARAVELTRRFDIERNSIFIDTRGWVLHKAGDYNGALQALTRAVASEESQPVYHYHLGMTYLKLDDERAAARELSKALESGRDFPGIDEARRIHESLK